MNTATTPERQDIPESDRWDLGDLFADDAAWEELIESSMTGAMEVVGEDVGVPLIVFEGSEPRGFYGPIMSPAPTGEEAAVAFDHLLGLASIPGFYELKRSRT